MGPRWRVVVPVCSLLVGLSGVAVALPAGASGPIAGPALAGVAEVQAGSFHSCARLTDGSVRCWGNNTDGRLGDGTEDSSLVPVGVVGVSHATSLSVGLTHSCVVVTTGRVLCWGSGGTGRLGNGTSDSSSVPTQVTGITNATSVSAGSSHTCARLATGTVRCWGANDIGQLGDGTIANALTPTPVSGLTTALGVSTGGAHTCARLEGALFGGGPVKCWGKNDQGQLGVGTTYAFSATPVSVSGLTNAVGVSGGRDHTCAAADDNTVSCWGLNDQGQLGNGTSTSASSPVSVTGLATATGVSVGNVHSCATLNSLSAACWGSGGVGQLGQGNNNPSQTPVIVPGMTNVDATDFTTCSVTATAEAACWGSGSFGKLGNGTTANATSPVPVQAGLCQASPDPGMGDVPGASYYAAAVAWLVAKGITSGTAPGVYSPNLPVSRAQMAVFLWRAAGQPTGNPPHGFGDVSTASYYNDAVEWLLNAGITSGTAPGVYSPNQAVTRAQMAVFLHRATGLLAAANTHSFGDVSTSAYYHGAVSWLVEVGITSGTGPGVYSPNQAVTRAQMAVFLNRRGCGTT